jgi:hypothetical protein
MESERLVIGCKAGGTDLIVGCDAKSHHTSWGSTNINSRGKSPFNYIIANGLDINTSNRLTFIVYKRREVTDITIATFDAGNFVKD